MPRFFCLFLSCLSFFYVDVMAQKLPLGKWRGVLFTQDSVELGFNFIVKNSPQTGIFLEVLNADEKISVTEIIQKGDSLFFKMPYFDNDFKVAIEGNTMRGQWIKNYPNKKVAMNFRAYYQQNWRHCPSPKIANKIPIIQGRWACDFESDDQIIVAEFNQNIDKVTGTFLTETGDYRYLEGCIENNKLYLSTFDGAHAYIFTAEIKGDSLKNGKFYSGFSYSENWTAHRDEKAKLRNADSLSFLKAGYDSIHFSFPDTKGKMHSLLDPEFKNKVVIVQLMGSWCPNCLDESKFLNPYYLKNKSKGLEVIGLSYERGSDFNTEKVKIERFIKQIGIQYPVVFAGTNNKLEASKTLPMLSEVFSFPTTIVIDKKGKVRKIHTGFSGPGTGAHYEEFVKEFDSFIQNLLIEN